MNTLKNLNTKIKKEIVKIQIKKNLDIISFWKIMLLSEFDLEILAKIIAYKNEEVDLFYSDEINPISQKELVNSWSLDAERFLKSFSEVSLEKKSQFIITAMILDENISIKFKSNALNYLLSAFNETGFIKILFNIISVLSKFEYFDRIEFKINDLLRKVSNLGDFPYYHIEDLLRKIHNDKEAFEEMLQFIINKRDKNLIKIFLRDYKVNSSFESKLEFLKLSKKIKEELEFITPSLIFFNFSEIIFSSRVDDELKIYFLNARQFQTHEELDEKLMSGLDKLKNENPDLLQKIAETESPKYSTIVSYARLLLAERYDEKLKVFRENLFPKKLISEIVFSQPKELALAALINMSESRSIDIEIIDRFFETYGFKESDYSVIKNTVIAEMGTTGYKMLLKSQVVPITIKNQLAQEFFEKKNLKEPAEILLWALEEIDSAYEAGLATY